MDAFSTLDNGSAQPPITRHLSKKDLYACIQVSKTFRDTYLPLLWSTLNLDLLLEYLDKKPIHLEHFTSGIWRNGSLVRELVCEKATEDNLLPLFVEMVVAPSCRNIAHLTLNIGQDERHKGWHKALFRNNTKSLTSLSIDSAENSMDLIAGYLSWSRFPNLKSLEFHMDIFCELEALIKIIDRCPRLNTLILEGLGDVLQSHSFPYGPIEPYNPTEIKYLAISGAASADVLLSLLPSCPKLTHLYISGYIDSVPGLDGASEMGAALQMAPTSITHLVYEGHANCNAGERDILTLLINLAHVPLQEIHIHSTKVGRDSFILIDEFFHDTLETLVVESFKSTNTDVVRNLLVRASRLRHFELRYPKQHKDHIDAWELVKQPWACSNLEYLCLPIGHDSKCTIYRKNNGNHDARQILSTLNPQMKALRHLTHIVFSCTCGKTVLSEYFARQKTKTNKQRMA